MSYYAVCKVCDATFKKRSMASRQDKCYGCGEGGRYNALTGVEKNSLNEKQEFYDRLETIEKDMKMLSDSIEGIVRRTIENQFKDVVKVFVEDVLDSKYGLLDKDHVIKSIATSHSRSSMNKDALAELKKQVSKLKASISSLKVRRENHEKKN